jgi:hypothetical protein
MRIPIMNRTIASLLVAGSAFTVFGAPPARSCTNALLEGGYGSTVGMIVRPANTPRAVLLRFVFDGKGNFTNAVTINDNGMVTHGTDSGTYKINPDCTGTVFTNGGTKTVEIVVVNNGKEFYSIRTDPPELVFLFNVARKQFTDD